MFSHIPVLGDISHTFYIIVLVFLVIFCILCLIRLIMGPSVADRVLAANMLGGIVIVIICVAAVMLGEDFLLDVGLVYALISFLAVVILSQIYIGVYRKRYDNKKRALKKQCEEIVAKTVSGEGEEA